MDCTKSATQTSKEESIGTSRASKSSKTKRSWFRRIVDFFLGKKRKQGSFDRGNSEGANQSQDGGDSGATTENEKIVAKRTPFTQLSSFKFRRELGRERLGGYSWQSLRWMARYMH